MRNYYVWSLATIALSAAIYLSGCGPVDNHHSCYVPPPSPVDMSKPADLKSVTSCMIPGKYTCSQTIDNDMPDFRASCVPSLCVCNDKTGCCCID